MTAQPSPVVVRTAPCGRPRRVLVLACGEASRGDDGAGFLAADLVRGWLDGLMDPPAAARGGLEALRDHVEVRTVGQLEPDDLLSAATDEAVVVIDAVRGIASGDIVRRSLDDLASGGPAPRSSHMLPLRDVLGLAQTLRGALPHGTFVGLGGSAFGLGEQVSGAVLEAIPALAAATIEEAARLVRD